MKKIVLLILCLTLCFSTFVFIGEDSLLASTSLDADVPASIIRVKLSVGDVSEISFTINGIYSINSVQLPAGTYRVRNENNILSLINNDGVILYTNSSSLMLHENLNPDPSAFNLVTLRAGGVNRNYLGSMKFWLNGSYIEVINHVYLEKYLYGVVAYEMSDSFPLEALKAQTVAARCYAVKRLEGVRGARQDIGDTSSDQVYKGFNPSLANVRQAVDATAGQVLLYGNSIISTYYAASNGGQTDRTENVWSSALPYFKIREDPYDLANPASLQKIVYFPLGSQADKDEVNIDPTQRYTQDDLDIRLLDFFRTQATQKLNSENASLPVGSQYDTNSSTIIVKAIVDMKAIQTSALPYCRHHAASTDSAPHDASNCPSIDFTGVIMTILLKVKQQNAEEAAGYKLVDYTWNFQFTISDYLKTSQYPQWQVFTPSNGLRIYAVESGNDPNGVASYKLINRRFGHGIGLSQRGAQQRAKDPNPEISQYQNILAFYYVNTVLADSGLTEPPILPIPTPTPTPRPSEMPPLTVIFRDWDGTLIKTETVLYAGSATAPAAPERTGYTFAGWDRPLDNIQTDLTITALYEPIRLKAIPASTLKIDQNQFLSSGVAAGMTVGDLLGQLDDPDSLIQIYTPENIQVTDPALPLSTGMQVRLVFNGEITDQKTIIILGDINSDGSVSALDLLQLKKYLLGQITLQPANGEAAKVTGNDTISALDLLKLKKNLLGQITIP